jgi:electron transfer flavoprotein-quinone oxidoreductase
VREREGVDIEILGGTSGVGGGAFLYTNLDTLGVGVVLKLSALAAQSVRPETIIAALKTHPSIAPLVDGGELVEYSAHLIPEAGVSMIPTLATHGMVVAGDAASLCLAAGIWLEGVNFAMASGMYAGEAVDDALRARDVTVAGLAGYERRLSSTFVLRDHRKLRRVPSLVLSDRVQHEYPQFAANVVERMFRVDNPEPKPGLRRIVRDERRRAGIRLRHLARDAWIGMRGFG